MAAPRPCFFGVGASFANYEKFSEALSQYCKDFRHAFTKNGRSIEVVNKTIRNPSKHFDKKFKYSTVRFNCKHFGKYESKSTGKRNNQTTCKLGCTSYFRLMADRKEDALIVTEWIDTHLNEDNEPAHPPSPDFVLIINAYFPFLRALPSLVMQEKGSNNKLRKQGSAISHSA
ncbi:hypothetical protein CAPTEDRAFT_209453 [Capitella teleta]|uniref:ZSWIM3 N-terminal domain-containing protein n=1 Tax=Capitella teleta TaxID=283909 RepID=R7UMY2_CAPTE|nr:hypothetical protein CAPTEDRAFT_209453 [Capitella teleta]|eukprot:ELU07453.1 hypothetical protein CAPTEDRAFT_209453 [Capitella teleta]